MANSLFFFKMQQIAMNTVLRPIITIISATNVTSAPTDTLVVPGADGGAEVLRGTETQRRSKWAVV